MEHRWGLGPVFAYEWLTRSRRWQAFALRATFVIVLLSGLALVWQSSTANTYLTVRQQLVQVGQSFFYTMAITQLALVLLAAPAATAGAICLDKARGTLAHVMVTDLSDAEVVLGKLAARLVPVLNLLACALPVAALGSLLGGIDPIALTAAFLIAVGLAVLGCSLALTLSVWMSKAHEVMTVVFAIWVLWTLALPIFELNSPGYWAPDWLKISNPFWLTLAPSNVPGMTSILEPIYFLIACLLISSGLAALSVAKVRRVYLRQSNQVPKTPKVTRVVSWFRFRPRWWPGPSLDRNPVLWREWHRNRPSRPTRIVWTLFIVLTSAISMKVIWDDVMNPGGPRSETAALLNAFQITIGLLLLSASAGTVLSEERVRGSLDVLLATPMSTHSIVWGKWWGAFRRAPWLAFWPTLVMGALTWSKPESWTITLVFMGMVLIIAQGAAIASLGLLLATWIERTGRAVTWTISAFVVSVIVWPITGFMLVGITRSAVTQSIQLGIVMGSPFYNSAMPTVMLENRFRAGMGIQRDLEIGVFYGAIIWAVAYSVLALILYLTTLMTFDRSLGRTPEKPVLQPYSRRRIVNGYGSYPVGQKPAPVLDFAEVEVLREVDFRPD